MNVMNVARPVVGVVASVWTGLAVATQATAWSVTTWFAPWRCLQWGFQGWFPVEAGVGAGLAMLAFMLWPSGSKRRDNTGFGTRSDAKRAGLGGTKIVFGQWK